MRKIIEIGIILFGLSLFVSCGGSSNKEVPDGTESTMKIIDVRNKAFEGRLKKIEKEFNAIQFNQGSAVLPSKASYPLRQLANLLRKNPEYKLSIIGHTSAEGSAEGNQKLSEARALSVYDYLVNECGVKGSRLTYEGKGSSELIDAEHPNSSNNRRTEFKIIK